MRPKRGPLDPTKKEMKREALQQFLNSTDLVPMAIHSPLSNNCYRATRLESPDSSGGGNGGGNGNAPESADPDRGEQVFLLLQCGLDFTVVVPVSSSHPLSWRPWRHRLPMNQAGRLQQHITRATSGITLQEPRFSRPPRIDEHPDGNGGRHPGWVNNFGLIAEGDVFHLFTNKPNERPGNIRKYWFGQNPAIWECE